MVRSERVDSTTTNDTPTPTSGTVQRHASSSAVKSSLHGKPFAAQEAALAPVQMKGDDPPTRKKVASTHDTGEWVPVGDSNALERHFRKRDPADAMLDVEFADVHARTEAQNAADEAVIRAINHLFDPLNATVKSRAIEKSAKPRSKKPAGAKSGGAATPAGPDAPKFDALLNHQGYSGELKDTGQRVGSAQAPVDEKTREVSVDSDSVGGSGEDGVYGNDRTAFAANTGIPVANLQSIDWSILVDEKGQKLFLGVLGFPVKSPATPRDQVWIDETELGGTTAGATSEGASPKSEARTSIPPTLGAPPKKAEQPTKAYAPKTTWFDGPAEEDKKIAQGGPARIAEKRAQLLKIRQFYAQRDQAIATYTPFL